MIGVGGYGKFYLREMEKKDQGSVSDPGGGVCDVMPDVEKAESISSGTWDSGLPGD